MCWYSQRTRRDSRLYCINTPVICDLTSCDAHCTTNLAVSWSTKSTNSYPKTESWWVSDRPMPPTYNAYTHNIATALLYSSPTGCVRFCSLDETSLHYSLASMGGFLVRLGDFKVLLASFGSVIFTSIHGHRNYDIFSCDAILRSLPIPPR